ncbi:MAG: glycine betaine ABC transporter substrate-binding protein, partial [Burkholderiaceae bacterium]
MHWLLTRRPGQRSTWALLALLVSLGLPCATLAQAQPAVRVASKIDTEGLLLGELIIRTLQAHGIKTENRLQLGNTQIVRTALIAGEIDLYPEYTGNGAFFFADEKNPAWKNHAAGYARVKSL